MDEKHLDLQAGGQITVSRRDTHNSIQAGYSSEMNMQYPGGIQAGNQQYPGGIQQLVHARRQGCRRHPMPRRGKTLIDGLHQANTWGPLRM